ncbi:pilus assembly protein [Jeongeupia wiesaeckerbachi]|uniref:TadE/TadG family type IV pilus assembly protein n=1 Tax=Jeongeupia wiesaeckerbachi TaxID=3051218 RepID=UPI003D80146F
MNPNFEQLRLGRQAGAITVEVALLLPVVMLVILAGVVLSDYQLASQRLHRATAAYADALANQPLPAGTRLWPRLSRDGDVAHTVFTGTLADPRDGEAPDGVGVRVSYLDTTADKPMATQLMQGECDAAPAALDDVAATLVTMDNVAKSELVRVEACLPYQPPLWLGWALPDELRSHFVAQRRAWRDGEAGGRR